MCRLMKELFMRKRKVQKIKEEKSKEVYMKQQGEGKKKVGKEEGEYQNIFRTFAEAQTATRLDKL